MIEFDLEACLNQVMICDCVVSIPHGVEVLMFNCMIFHIYCHLGLYTCMSSF